MLGARDLTTSPSTAASAKAALNGDAGSIEVAELYAPFTHQQLILTEAIGLNGSTKVNPSGGALAANPMFSTGLERIGFAARHIFDGSAQRVLAHATSGAALQQNLVAVMEGKNVMAGNLAAVLGTGQTKYVAKRKDVSMNGLVREAIDKALEDSGSTFDDIDAVVVGKAPDFFEGVMMPELFMADAVGATGKPLIRVHTAGSVGGSTAIVAASLVQSGKYKRVLTMAWEKQSESNAMWALSIPVPFTKPVGAGAGGYFAPHVRSYIRRSGRPTTSVRWSR